MKARLFKHFFNSLSPFNRPTQLLLGVCLLMNGLVLTNAILNDPRFGPDSTEHLKYVSTLAEMRLPTPSDSAEYYSPPLPYLFPALLMRLFSMDIWWAAKCAQLLQVLLSVGLVVYLIKVCEVTKAGDVHFKLATVGFLGLFTVYYKTFAWVRGEPYVAFWSVVVVYYTLQVFARHSERRRSIVLLGLAMGLLALSRQWGLLLAPALSCFVGILALKQKRDIIPHLKAFVVSLILAVSLSGGFYWFLQTHRGSAVSFGLERASRFAFSNQPSSFYFGLSLNRLFSDPVRPGFTNEFIPVFYSDLWGDYKAHFLVYGRDTRSGARIRGQALEDALTQTPMPDWLQTNRSTIAPYLGRVNLLALLPTALALTGLFGGLVNFWKFVRHPLVTEQTKTLSLSFLVVGSSLAGYAWFLIMYPNIEQGDTIKATYMLHIFPFVSLLVGHLLQAIHRRSHLASMIIIGLLCVVFVHNLPAMITRYLPW